MQAVFGVLSIISAVLTLFYPETNGQELKTSLDEAEEFYKKKANLFKSVGYTNFAYKNE